MDTPTEVICYGSVIPDRVLRLPRFPLPGEGIHALSEKLYLGGEPCNVGGHLATWQVPVTIAGNNVGADSLGDFVRAQLAQRQWTKFTTRHDPAVQTPTCYIWTTPDGERTIVPSWPTATGWSLPDREAMQSARIVSVSIYGPGMDEMIALARHHACPLAVADIAGPNDPRLPGAAIVTTSQAVLQRRYAVDNVQAWIEAVQAASGALVVVSSGANAVRILTPDRRWLTAVPPRVDPVDSTGAGDALKAGVIFGWLNKWPIEQTLRWGIAAASIQCTRHGPCEQPATSREIETLLGNIPVQESDGLVE